MIKDNTNTTRLLIYFNGTAEVGAEVYISQLR